MATREEVQDSCDSMTEKPPQFQRKVALVPAASLLAQQRVRAIDKAKSGGPAQTLLGSDGEKWAYYCPVFTWACAWCDQRRGKLEVLKCARDRLSGNKGMLEDVVPPQLVLRVRTPRRGNLEGHQPAMEERRVGAYTSIPEVLQGQTQGFQRASPVPPNQPSITPQSSAKLPHVTALSTTDPYPYLHTSALADSHRVPLCFVPLRPRLPAKVPVPTSLQLCWVSMDACALFSSNMRHRFTGLLPSPERVDEFPNQQLSRSKWGESEVSEGRVKERREGSCDGGRGRKPALCLRSSHAGAESFLSVVVVAGTSARDHDCACVLAAGAGVRFSC
ncbi:hypothetical protein NDU88_002106 [Pleurodeles waltl]|uniref:Uncharacterized protein n=1 Tax=Pleurodeles waltl TaxID=8319 RepID=A0AAV7MMD7_PLEWA|nr:hypothetical protein NDU88_002106 [Pleurodeles waltl]